MKTFRLAYWIFLGLFSVMMLGSLYNYLFEFDATLIEFQKLGYPDYLIHPLIIAQGIGIAVLISNQSKWMVEWAYAGFFMNLVFAIMAHYMSKHGNGAAAVVCLILLWTVYVLKRLNEMIEIEEAEAEALTKSHALSSS